MTDREWFQEIIGVLDCVGSVGSRSAVYDIIHRIRLAEQQRCARLAEDAGDKAIAKLILGTSPSVRKAER